MTEHDENEGQTVPSRRQFLRNAGFLGTAAMLGPAFLAACGSSSKSSSGSATTAAGATATTAAGGAGTTAAAATGDAGTQLAKMLAIDPATAGKGKDFQMGAVLALTGSGSFYGKTMSRGIDLAVKHIAAAGGPNIKVTYWDHKSGDAPAGKQAITEIVAKKIPAKLASYVDDLGAMLEDTAKNKIFTLDGGGGTSSYRPLWVMPAAAILARMSTLMMPLFGSPMSQPTRPTLVLPGLFSSHHLNRPGIGSFGVMARVPQKYGCF